VRFRVPENKAYAFDDEIRGRVEFQSGEVGGDWIMMRPDGMPTYNFAVVVDDHLMRITHVIRGEEHLSNTPRQLMVYEAIGAEPPKFAHLPLILNQDRKKMSKRDESIIQFIDQYRELGYLPEAIVNFIALLGWSPGGEQELFTLGELIEHFRLDRISKSGAVFDTEKLSWMNNAYLRGADPARVVELAIPHLRKAGRIGEAFDRAWLTELVSLYLEQMRCAADIVGLAEMFFADEPATEPEAAEVLAEAHVPAVLSAFAVQVKVCPDDGYTAEGIGAMLKAVQKETGYKGKQLFMPVRAAITGQTHGRDLNRTLWLLGKAKVLARLEGRLASLAAE